MRLLEKIGLKLHRMKQPDLVPRCYFDPEWYLQVNPDVAAAGIDPWQHYSNYGAREGRAAAPLRALALDHILWRGFAREAEAELRLLLTHENELQRASAGWVLARYAAACGKWYVAHAAIQHYVSAPAYAQNYVTPRAPLLLAVQAAARSGHIKTARRLSRTVTRRMVSRNYLRAGRSADTGPMTEAQSRDPVLAEVEVATAFGAKDRHINRLLQRLYKGTGCATVALAPGVGSRFDRLNAIQPIAPVSNVPLISVVVPAYNSGATLSTCLRGLMKQSWRNLEIIVVDDASTDDTTHIVEAARLLDSRIRLIRQPRNEGAYLARNAGFDEARGVFFTIHDADDWSHPQKLEFQARALIDRPDCMASVSHWVRVDPHLRMGRWRMEEGWIYRNISSLMIRRDQMRTALGYWDRVRANADTEYYHRICAAFGADAITEVLAGVPLSFGRSHAGTLTQSTGCHLATQFIGARRSYMEAATDWQRRQIAALPEGADTKQKAAALYRSGDAGTRAFFAPTAIGPADENPPDCDYAQCAGSDLLDPIWYWRRHSDILAADGDPVGHFMAYGASEDRDPGPLFSTSAWRQVMGLDAQINPLIARSWQAGLPPATDGALADMGAPIALVFAHSADAQVFGAERSLLLTLERLAAGYDGPAMAPVVVLPMAVNPGYIADIRARAKSVVTLPQVWRHRFRAPPPQTVSVIRELIRHYRAAVVHVNTLTLDAPLLAARFEGCPSVMHVRELPEQDPALCRILGDTPQGLRRYVLRAADRFTANAQTVADWLDCPDRVTLWPNRVDAQLGDLPFAPEQRLRVGLVSSNIAKKGISDFCHVARLVAALEEDAELSESQHCRFLLIGPETADLATLKPLPENVVHTGYAENPVAALVQCDLVLVLSHFAESFGRTALEALSAGRPVICYDRGTPPRFVADNNCGLVVGADDVVSVAKAVFELACNRDRLAQMSVHARHRAQQIMADDRVDGERRAEPAAT